MAIQDQIGQIQQNIGTLLEGQRNAENSRRVMHEKQERQDDILDQISARLKDIAVTTQMSAENVVKLTARIETEAARITAMEPAVKSNSEFRILAGPLVKIVRQIRLYIVALIAFITALAGGIAVAWAYGGPIIKAAVKLWLSSTAP